MSDATKYIEYRYLTKGQKLLTNQLGVPITSILMESPKQGRGLKSTILVDTKGSEIGMFDEMGSIYADNIVSALDTETDTWLTVIGKPESGFDLLD